MGDLPQVTPSERVAIGKAIEELIGKRQGQRTDKQLLPELAEVPRGRNTVDIAADKAGFGGRETYRQAKKVVEEAVPELLAAMDAGKVEIFPQVEHPRLLPACAGAKMDMTGLQLA